MKKEHEKLEKYQGPKEGTEDNVQNKGQSSSLVIGALWAVTPKLGLSYSRSQESYHSSLSRRMYDKNS